MNSFLRIGESFLQVLWPLLLVCMLITFALGALLGLQWDENGEVKK